MDPKEEKKDEKVKEPAKTKFVYKRDSRKTLREIAAEVKIEEKPKEPAEATPETQVKEDPKVVEKKTPDEEAKLADEKAKLEKDRLDLEKRQIADDAAKKASEETRKEFQAKMDEILNKDKDIQDKQKEADDLVAIWDKEKRLPKDWKEIASEQLRIADVKLEQRLKAEKANEEARRTEERLVQEKKQQDVVKDNTARLESYQKELANDLDKIYYLKELPRVTNPKELENPDTTDPAAKEVQKVFTFGVQLNQKLKAEGKEPVKSLWDIYFNHYKPYTKAQGKSDQPAGGDAPVSGAKNVIQNKQPEKYNWRTDSKKSLRQIAAEEQARIKGRAVTP